jgi:hypothetical protein
MLSYANIPKVDRPTSTLLDLSPLSKPCEPKVLVSAPKAASGQRSSRVKRNNR